MSVLTNDSLFLSKIGFNSWFIDEIPIYFGNDSKDFDPKRGITIHGPADWSSDDPPSSIKIGIIGTGDGIHETRQFFNRIENKIHNNAQKPFIRPQFPGMKNSFRCKFKLDRKWEQIISSLEVKDILRTEAYDLRVKKAVEIYANKVSNIDDMISRPDVIICHQTEELEKSIGAAALTVDKNANRLTSTDRQYYDSIRKKIESHDILFPLDDDTQNMLDMLIPNDFKQLLKSKCLIFDIPTQILTHGVIRSVIGAAEDINYRSTDDDPATIAWNLSVALYYKSGHLPWRISNLRSGTCYVGISFYHDKTGSTDNMQTSLAQIFTDTGEGLIMRGKRFKWDSTKGKTVHLNEDAASNLLSDAISVYQNHKGQLPERVVIHKSSTYNTEELNGFNKARKGIPFYDYVALSKNHTVYLYRNGEHAVLRGTVLELDNKNLLIFTTGYVPYLRSYVGLRTPRPIQITEHYGDSTPEEIVREILALTRLNWNTASFSTSWPMTLQFSKSVGSILSRVREGDKIQTQYRYYM